jgi:hypothetical protein
MREQQMSQSNRSGALRCLFPPMAKEHGNAEAAAAQHSAQTQRALWRISEQRRRHKSNRSSSQHSTKDGTGMRTERIHHTHTQGAISFIRVRAFNKLGGRGGRRNSHRNDRSGVQHMGGEAMSRAAAKGTTQSHNITGDCAECAKEQGGRRLAMRTEGVGAGVSELLRAVCIWARATAKAD